MTGGVVYTIRLFPAAEKQKWADVLDKHNEADYVGVSWNGVELGNYSS